MASPKPDHTSLILLRLPKEMHEACKSRAARERRSLNAQLLVVIDEWLHELEERQHALVSTREE
jgi:hypothetical protein